MIKFTAMNMPGKSCAKSANWKNFFQIGGFMDVFQDLRVAAFKVRF